VEPPTAHPFCAAGAARLYCAPDRGPRPRDREIRARLTDDLPRANRYALIPRILHQLPCVSSRWLLACPKRCGPTSCAGQRYGCGLSDWPHRAPKRLPIRRAIHRLSAALMSTSVAKTPRDGPDHQLIAAEEDGETMSTDCADRAPAFCCLNARPRGRRCIALAMDRCSIDTTPLSARLHRYDPMPRSRRDPALRPRRCMCSNVSPTEDIETGRLSRLNKARKSHCVLGPRARDPALYDQSRLCSTLPVGPSHLRLWRRCISASCAPLARLEMQIARACAF